MLQVGTDFNRDLDRMVAQCLRVTPKTLEGICLDKESKTLVRTAEIKIEDDNQEDGAEDRETLQGKDSRIQVMNSQMAVKGIIQEAAECIEAQQQSENTVEVVTEEQNIKLNVEKQTVDEICHSEEPANNIQNIVKVFKQAAMVARRNCSLIDLSKQEQDDVVQKLSSCHWVQEDGKLFSEGEMLQNIVKAIRETILTEVQDSPFFSIIIDRAISVGEAKFLPVFVRYVNDCIPKVELIGFLPFDESSDVNLQAKALSATLEDEWGLQMGCCRGQSIMCMGTGSQSLRKMALDFLECYPLAVNTPSESCGLAYWLSLSLQNASITKVLDIAEDLLQFFDQSPRLESELAKTMDGLLNTPREALAEIPETCLSRWKKREDFFDILVDMLEGALNCLDLVTTNPSGSWSSSMSLHALTLSTTIRQADFVIRLVILKNACAPLRNCSTVFRCGNPADIICELEKIVPIIDTLSKMLENVSAVHSTWFEEAVDLATKVTGLLSYPESVSGYKSPEVFYKETVSIPVLNSLIEEMKFNFSENHLKALKVLSLLPTCNPLPILPESTDKLHTIYMSDLPEPETAEEDINTWATLWREKYQDVSPPTSISETLLHNEAKNLPNVATLLKLVAVLPSISMECDLMKTTLNSLRTLLKDGFFSRGSKSDAVMLLMHRQALQSLDEVIEKCMESDTKSHQFLAQVKARANHLRMESEVIAMAPQEITVDTNGSNYQHVAKDAVIEVNTATSEEISMETNGSTCIELAKETSVITLEGSEKPATALQVIHACSSLMISTSLQPTESIQDAIKQSTAVEQDRTGELMAVQNVNDGSEVLDQCGIGLTVTEDQSASNQLMAVGHGRIEQSEIELQVRTGQLVSVDQNETDQPMEVDESGNEQFVAPDQVGTDQPAISEQIVPDSFMEAGQVKTDQSSVEGQDEGCHTVTGLAHEGGTGPLGSGDHNASVQLSAVGHGVNEQLVSGYQSESDQVMEVDQSGDYQSVAADQGGTDQPVSEQSVAELLAVGQVETGQSVLEGQDEVCQRVTGLGDEGKLVTGEQLLSDQLMAVDDSKKGQSILAEKCGTGDTGVTGDKSVADQFMAVGQVETEHSIVAGQVEASQTETANEDETSRLVSEDQNESEQVMFDTTDVQCVTADQIVTDQFMTVGQDKTVYSMVERETETDQTETDLANVGAVDKLVSGDQGGSDSLIVVDDSGNVQSVTVNQNGTGQSVTGNQSIADQFIAVGQVETDKSIVEHQEKAGLTEMGLANEAGTALLISEEQGGSDQLMVVDSENNHSADQNRIGQSVTGDQFVAVQFMAVEVETNHTIVESQEKADPTEMGLANECRTGQLVSGDQSRSEQIMMVDSGSDQSITADQNRIGQSRTGEQHFADLFMAVETDRSIVRGHENVAQTEMGLAEEGGTGHSASGDQSGSEQLIVVDSGNYQCVTADQNKIDQSVADLFVAVEVESERSIVKGQENSGQTEIGLANVGGTGPLVLGGQSGSEQLMVVDSGNDQFVTAAQSGTRQSVIDQHIAHPFMAVEVDTDHSIVEGQNEAGQTEIRLANESASHLVSDYQIGSYQLMVVDDSENDLSVTAEQNVTGQSVTGDQSVPDQFVAVGQVETDQFIVEGQNEAGQTETEVANRGGTGQLVSDNQCGSDQLMVVDESGNDQSVRDQVTTHQPTVEGLGGAGQIISWNQCVTDQPMADECCENDQTVVKARVGTSLSNTYNQSVPDQFVSLSQDGTDQIVPGNLSGIDQSKAEDQSRPDQPQLAAKHGTEQFSLPAPNETASVHADPDLPSITDHSTPASHDITDQSLAHNIIDHSSAPEIEGTDQSKSTVQDGANKVASLDGTGPAQRVLTLYDTAAREELLKELCGIKYFTIVTEEELEIDGQAYIPVGIHYLDKQDDQCENILAFIPLVKNITSFVDTLTFVLSEKWGLNFAFCRGQTLARPNALVSQMRQASALLSQRLSHAFGVLNPFTLQTLTASASSIREIMHSFECLEQLLRWFSDDVQRRVRLEEAVVHLFKQDEKANELKAKLSNNQWAMSHEILEISTDILEAIILCLNEMKGDHNNEANAKQAQSFLSTIQNFDFILTIVIMKNILSLTKNLCQSLQGNSYDVYQAVNSQPDILSSLSELKNRIETHHQIWFQEAFALASKLQATMHLSLQPPVNVHYREDISKRTVEHCIAEVEGLSQDILSALRCLLVVPYVMSKVEGCCKDIEFFKVFQEDLPDPGSLQAELQRWWDRWQGPIASHQHLPDTIIGTLKISDIMSFPNISTILRLLAVLSCSNMQGSFRQGKITSELYPL
ncbi:uncharacterized protein LOC127635465 [Xyrauchen texanus]|uniref:uncharacterized protein LOC127635465 n=1 Tax=Xyrauchen texanus TaxID=154827 RepID=UPI00224213F0|nr:uncharacterized protein LOC127635465 [Xyrauchen texanus]